MLRIHHCRFIHVLFYKRLSDSEGVGKSSSSPGSFPYPTPQEGREKSLGTRMSVNESQFDALVVQVAWNFGTPMTSRILLRTLFSRENELLKHQLKKYVGAVQMMRSDRQGSQSRAEGDSEHSSSSLIRTMFESIIPVRNKTRQRDQPKSPSSPKAQMEREWL